MGLLLDQFVSAAKNWQQGIEQPYRESRQNGIVTYVMFWTGGGAFTERLERMDSEGLTLEQRKTLTVGEVDGYYSIAQMQSHIEGMSLKFFIQEPFLIVALVRAVEDEFERMVENYEGGVAKIQAEIKQLQEIDADPEQKAVYLQEMREASEKLIAEGRVPADSEPIEEGTIQSHIEMLERFDQFSPEKKAQRQQHLDLWREVTRELMATENLERAQTEWFDAMREKHG